MENKTSGRKAILIEGARRIGKSTIAEEFEKNNYRSYKDILNYSSLTKTKKKYLILMIIIPLIAILEIVMLVYCR